MSDDERRAPVQGDAGCHLHASHPARPANALPDGTISWAEHEAVWAAYSARYGGEQSAERIAQRGGFGHSEIRMFLGRNAETFTPHTRR